MEIALDKAIYFGYHILCYKRYEILFLVSPTWLNAFLSSTKRSKFIDPLYEQLTYVSDKVRRHDFISKMRLIQHAALFIGLLTVNLFPSTTHPIAKKTSNLPPFQILAQQLYEKERKLHITTYLIKVGSDLRDQNISVINPTVKNIPFCGNAPHFRMMSYSLAIITGSYKNVLIYVLKYSIGLTNFK